MADHWSNLPEHLLNLVTKLLEFEDLIRFNCVCQNWKSLSSSLLPSNQNPWLIVPYGGYISFPGSTICNQTLGFFNLSNQQLYRVETPQIANRRICGSCQGGWLITVHENGEIQVLHPFSKSVIDLPPITELPGVSGSFVDEDSDLVYNIPTGIGKEEYRDNIISSCIREFYIYKAVMSSTNPSTGIVVAIQGLCKHLAFCRPGKDMTWSPIEGDGSGRFVDITFYEGKFYAVNKDCQVFVVDRLDSASPVIRLLMSPTIGFSLDKFYLVESLGELLLIRRVRWGPTDFCDLMEEDSPSYMTRDFTVAKLDIDGGSWVEVNDLGIDRALFVGYNDSFSVSTSDFLGCKGNSIYFTDDNLEELSVDQPFGGHDVGVFHLKYGYIDKCYPSDSKLIKPPPVWFTTSSRFLITDRWSQLPEHLLELITKRLELEDMIRFSCVCRQWKSFSSSLLCLNHKPWLIVPYGGYRSNEGTICDKRLGFFNLSNRKVYKVETPEIANRRICGSCRGGWLITLHENGEIQAFHPFSKSVIDLPPVPTLPGVSGCFVDEDDDLVYSIPTGIGNEELREDIVASCVREFYIFKAIMSSSNPGTSIVMAIQGLAKHLVYCKPGKDKKWSSLGGDHHGKFVDITFYQGKFYAVNKLCQVFVVEGLDSPSPFIKLVIFPNAGYSLDKYYLVESLGELLLVRRVRYSPTEFSDLMAGKPPFYKTGGFGVSKLDIDRGSWVDVNDLGIDRALFVGYNDSFSISTSDFPGCKGNSIYFTDDNVEELSTQQPFGGHDLGVFHLKYGSIKKFYRGDSKLIKPPPVWFKTSQC